MEKIFGEKGKLCVYLHPQFEKGKTEKAHWNTSVEREVERRIDYHGEFDPGSGWTLAAGLIHASRGVP